MDWNASIRFYLQVPKKSLNTFSVKQNKIISKDYLIAELTPDAMMVLQSISDIEFRYDIAYVSINPSELKHIFHRHYGKNEKAPQQGKPLTDTDISLIVDVLDKPDKLISLGHIEKHQAETYLFLKKNEDNTVVIIEVFGSKNNKLTSVRYNRTLIYSFVT